MRVEYSLGLPKEAIDIREEVFMKEQGFEDEFDDLDPISYHVVLYIKNKAVATARTFLQDGDYIVGRVAVVKEMRKQDLGRKVMEAIEDKIQELGGTKIVLSAQVQAKGFYQALGYECIGKEYLDEHCPHIKMEKRIQEK